MRTVQSLVTRRQKDRERKARWRFTTTLACGKKTPELDSSAERGSLDPLVRALRDEGYAVADGIADVHNLIHAVSDDSTQPLCSGYRVFPDGKRCEGCADCSPNASNSATPPKFSLRYGS